MIESNFPFEHFWEIAQKTKNISPEISRHTIKEMLEGMRSELIPLPKQFVELFCFSCFTIFTYGENCKVFISSHRKHPNTKIIHYQCLTCKAIQCKNVLRDKNLKNKMTPKQKNAKKQIDFMKLLLTQ